MTLAPLLVLLTCVVASVSYIGAVTQSALATMVLPLVVAAGALATMLRARPLAALCTVVLVSGAGGEAVNVISGNYQGSVARSAGVASLLTGLAVVIGGTQRPAMFLVPVAGIVAWALALGAGGRVELVAVVAAGLGLLTLAAVERDRRAFESQPRLGGTVLMAVLLIGAAGVLAAHFQLRHDGRPAASPFRESLATTIVPPTAFALTRHPPPSATSSVQTTAAPTAAPSSHHPRLHQLARGLFAVLLGTTLLLLVGLSGRLLWVSFSWRRLRRRLQRRVDPVEVGAWVWTLAAMDRLGSPIPRHVSPDLAAAGLVELSEPVRTLAQTVAPVVFAYNAAERPSDAWPHARAAIEHAWHSTGRLGRLRARWRMPRMVTRGI